MSGPPFQALQRAGDAAYVAVMIEPVVFPHMWKIPVKSRREPLPLAVQRGIGALGECQQVSVAAEAFGIIGQEMIVEAVEDRPGIQPVIGPEPDLGPLRGRV